MADGTEANKVARHLQLSSLDGKSAYVDKISQHFKNDKLSDIVLVVGGKRYPAHKTILAALSPFFERMFYGSTWKEGNEGDVKLEELQICADVFETFLRYFYSGSVSVTRETVIPIVTLADKYDVDSLKDICTSYMINMLYTHHDIEAGMSWVTFAEQMRMHDLQKKCYDLICFNFEKAFNLTGWSSLSLEQVLNVLKRSDIVVSNEYVVFQAVEAWLKDKTTTKEEVSQLFSYIQFKNMTVQQMCQVEKSALSSKYESGFTNPLTPYLSDAFRYVAVKNFYPEGDREPASFQRLYTCSADSSTKLTTARFDSKCCVEVKPICSISSEPSKYRWEFGKFNSSDKYQIKLPSVSRNSSYTNYYLYSTLPLTYKFKGKFIIRNKAGYILCAMNDGSFKAQIPKLGGRILGEFSELHIPCKSADDPDNVAYDVMYSFVIENV